jgi:hypothetical protein
VVGGKVVFNCEHLGIINSIGAATWVSNIGAFSDLRMAFRNCPHTFTALCLMLPGFTATGVVESLYVRYNCSGCMRLGRAILAHREEALRQGGFKPVQCPTCGRPMQPDEDDEELIGVLRGDVQEP